MKLFVRRHLDMIWRTFFSLGLMILAVSCSSQFSGTPIDSSTPVASTAPSQAAPLPSATTSRVLEPAPTPLPSENARVSPVTPPSPGQNPGTQLTITLADDGKTITLKNGQVFLLSLGPDFDWRVEVADQTVLSRIPNITVVKQAQGVYKANKPGTTALNAHGTIICPPLKVCAEATREFQVQVLVQ